VRRLVKQSVEVLKPLMAAPTPSIPVRRAYGLAMTYFGFSQIRTNEEEGAVTALAEARDAYRGIDGLTLRDISAAVAYAEASAWQMQALQTVGRLDESRQVGEAAMKVTAQVLERRPGDMSALRAEALIVDSLAGIEWTGLHLRRAMELTRQSARDWEAIVKLDPTNQIAWNNLVDSRMSVTGQLYSIGDVRGAREQLRAALELEHHVKNSGMIGNVMSLAAGYLARLEADTGNRQAALAAMSSNQRFVALATRSVPRDSFGSVFLPEFLGNYGFPGSGLGYGALAIPYADGDYETVRRIARDSIKRMEQLKDVPAPQQQARNTTLEIAYRTSADASYRLNEYAIADSDIRHAVELRKAIPTRTLGERRDEAGQATLAAMIAARLERYAEARRLIEPVLELHRGLFARADNEDLTQHIEFAQALYVSAQARSSARAAELKQAAGIIDALPPAMRALISVGRLRASIADAQGP
jgi:tetratricopeptide (TPR) repeat protein